MGFIINLTIALVLFTLDIERETTPCEVMAYLKLYFFLVSIKVFVVVILLPRYLFSLTTVG